VKEEFYVMYYASGCLRCKDINHLLFITQKIWDQKHQFDIHFQFSFRFFLFFSYIDFDIADGWKRVWPAPLFCESEMDEGMWISTGSTMTSDPAGSSSDGLMLLSDPTSVFFNSTWPFPEMSDGNGTAITGNTNNNRSSGTVLTAFGDMELDLSVIERFRSNRRVNDVAFFCLVAAYCLLIIFGTIGNSLVVYVVACQPAMRTARNVFVVNLAISDLLLCLITMPLTVSLNYLSTFPNFKWQFLF
jgi:hypothetical protein